MTRKRIFLSVFTFALFSFVATQSHGMFGFIGKRPSPNSDSSKNNVSPLINKLNVPYVFSFFNLGAICHEQRNQNQPQCRDSSAITAIHGLWPDQKAPQGCRGASEINNVSPDTLKQMKRFFLGNLFVHEWEKHGTCSGQTAEQFMTTTITLYNKYKDTMDSVMKSINSITPTITVDQAAKILRSAGILGVIQCYNDGGIVRISEVFICFDNQYNLIPCGSDVLYSQCPIKGSINTAS